MRRLVLLALLAILPSCQPPGSGGGPPNFLIIITDDQRWDAVGEFMPITQARIFDQGINFTRGYVTTPLCCPSRASIFTGMYAHNHEVRTNDDPLLETTFAERLHASSYFTGQVGKYLNSWDGTPRPEFDFWVSFSGGGIFYLNPTLNANGHWLGRDGYITNILRDYALGFLEQAAQRDQPFLLIFAPTAPHAPARPAPADGQLYRDLLPHRPSNYNEDDIWDKPRWLQEKPPLTPADQANLDNLRRKQLATLKPLDEAIEEIIDLLEDQGRLDNTVIIYLSDNGFLWGEHRLERKGEVYEPAIRVPFALRYPRLVPQGRVEDRLVANIDIAPTIYELAGLAIPAGVDGRSLAALLEGTDEWREDLLLEGWRGGHPWVAVHTVRYVYVETEGDIAELYDLQEDPYQLQNLAYDPAYAAVVAEMQERLQRLRGD